MKHVPLRTCIVTREKLPKSDLIRIVKTDEGEVKVDPKGKLTGRGANIKMDPQLLESAISKGMLSRALKLKRKLTQEEINSLKADFVKIIDEKTFRGKNKSVKIRVKKEELEKLVSNA